MFDYTDLYVLIWNSSLDGGDCRALEATAYDITRDGVVYV